MRHVTDIRRFIAGMVVTMLLACAAVLLTPAAPAHAAGTSYYVDCSAAANGTGTSGSPWNSLAGPNAKTFAPGDQLLLSAYLESELDGVMRFSTVALVGTAQVASAEVLLG